MICRETDLNIDYEGYGLESPMHKATITSYLLDNSQEVYLNRKRPAVIICPGGGYDHISKAEGEPIALSFCAKGFHSFVLTYSVWFFGRWSSCGKFRRILERSVYSAFFRV